MSTEVPGTPEGQKDVQEPTVTEQQPAAQPQAAQADPSKDEVTMGMLAHLLGLLYIIGPLIIWLIKKDESKYVGEQAKEALNFQITAIIGFMAAGILSLIGIGFVITPIVWIGWLVFIILGTIEANKGVQYKYPVNLRLIK